MTPIQPTPADSAAAQDAGKDGHSQAWPGLDPELIPDLSKLVTQDDTPVDNIYVEKQERLLTEPLYSSWPGPGGPFLALANVGWFYAYKEPPLVPDMMLSLGVVPGGPLHTKEGHSYYQWIMGKSPEVVIEVVSDRTGGEEGHKMKEYARRGALFYVIHDPEEWLGGGVLRALVLQRGRYEPVDPKWFPEVGLGLILWQGAFEGRQETWLRWCDKEGNVIPTGAESADEERRRADEERRRAEEKIRRLQAQVRALGAEPDV